MPDQPKKFVPPTGHSCDLSEGIHEQLTFGTGELSFAGFWSEPCAECARAWEKQFPEDAPCWPHTHEQLVKMGMKKE